MLVYEEKDERFDLGAFKTRSQAYIFMISASHTTTEARYIPATQPTEEWKIAGASQAGRGILSRP